MKCLTVLGTRPEFIQASCLSHAIRARHGEVLVNTGQHYDDSMAKVFFDELELPRPGYELNVGAEGSSHARQTAAILTSLEPVLEKERPDWVIVYGDTNTSIAAALVASKLGMPIAHVEAGLRSFDRRMPEEINRVLIDHVSDVLFSPTTRAVTNLSNEGIREGVVNVGDVRIDVLRRFVPKARERRDGLLAARGLRPDDPFAIATVHRASNTDDPVRLRELVDALGRLEVPVVLPVHPRLKRCLERARIALPPSVRAGEPVGFLDLLSLLDACSLVVTDSGGLQKEAYLMERPCLTLRDTTEWVETVEVGWNRLLEPGALPDAARSTLGGVRPPHPNLYGEPGVSDRIIDVLEARLDAVKARQTG
jgi:UDP-N-acetylglucosamine 2-epimerase